MDAIRTLADHAAQQTDRWLFLALLCVVLFGVFFSARYLMKDRERLIAGLETVVREQLKTTEHVASVVATNTEALNRVASEIRFCATGRNHIRDK